jgi:hypothetical protein
VWAGDDLLDDGPPPLNKKSTRLFPLIRGYLSPLPDNLSPGDAEKVRSQIAIAGIESHDLLSNAPLQSTLKQIAQTN